MKVTRKTRIGVGLVFAVCFMFITVGVFQAVIIENEANMFLKTSTVLAREYDLMSLGGATTSHYKTFYFNAHNVNSWTDSDLITDDDSHDPPATYGYIITGAVNPLILTGNNCTGKDYGYISGVKFRVYDEKSGTAAVSNTYTPRYTSGKSGTPQVHTLGAATWTSWYDITSDTNAPKPWTWTDVVSLDMRVNATTGKSTQNRVYIVQINVTYSDILEVSNPVPANQSTGITVPPASFYISIVSNYSRMMNITWQTNSSGSWTTFDTTLNVHDGTYSVTSTSWVTTFGKKYWWNVLVNDGCGNWCNKTYYFTTNYAPIQLNPVPANKSALINVPPTVFSLDIRDPDGDYMNITWQTNASGTWKTANITSNVHNGTYNLINKSWVNTYDKKYWWRAMVNDGKGGWKNATYHFTTKSNPISISNPVPANSSIEITVPPPRFNITLVDHDVKMMNITWQENSSGSWITFNTTLNVYDGTYSVTNTSWVDTRCKKYWWRVLVNDGMGGWQWHNETYHFTTEPRIMFSNPVPANDSDIACNVAGTNTSIDLTFGNTTYSAGNGINFYSNKYLFNDSVYENAHQTVPIDGTHFLVAYVDDGDGDGQDDGIVKVGTESSGVISYGPSTIFHSDNTTALAMQMMTDTHFVIVYNWYETSVNEYHLNCKVGSVSGTVITLGTNVSVGNGLDGKIQQSNPIDKLNDTHFVIAVQGPNSYANATIGNISGLNVQFGSWYQALTYPCFEYRQIIKALSEEKIVIMFADLYMDNCTCVIGNVGNGNEITFGESNVFLTEDAIAEYSMTVLDETRFVIAHPYNGTTILVATVSGNTIIYGENQTIESSVPIDGITLRTLNETKFVISYEWGADVSEYKGVARIGTVSGDDIVLHTSYLMNTGTTRDIYINNLSSSKIVASFIQRAGFPPDNAYHLIGTITSGFELTWYSNSSHDTSVILRPEGNGFITGLTKSTGDANYKCVDESIANEDTDYVYAVGGVTDTYVIQDSSHSGIIDNITVYARMRMYNNLEILPCTANWGKITLRVNGYYYNSSTFLLAESWVTYTYKWTTNPNTGSAWTWDDIDSLQAGISLGGSCYSQSRCTQVYVKVNSTSLWTQYGQNVSVVSGTYSQFNENFSVCGAMYWWYVNVSDGNVFYISDMYHFTMTSVIIFDINKTSFSFGIVLADSICYSNQTGGADTFRIFNNGTSAIDIDVNGTNATGSGVSPWVLSATNGDNLYKMEVYNSTTGWHQINLATDTWYSNLAALSNITTNLRVTTPTIFYSGTAMACSISMWASIH